MPRGGVREEEGGEDLKWGKYPSQDGLRGSVRRTVKKW